MKVPSAFPIIIIVIASTGAYVSTLPRSTSPSLDEVAVASSPVETSPALLAHHGDRDEVAIHDMTLHAFRNLGAPTACSESFGSELAWTPGWELRWLQFDCGDASKLIYHATAKMQPSIRFTVTADSNDVAFAWEQAR